MQEYPLSSSESWSRDIPPSTYRACSFTSCKALIKCHLPCEMVPGNCPTPTPAYTLGLSLALIIMQHNSCCTFCSSLLSASYQPRPLLPSHIPSLHINNVGSDFFFFSILFTDAVSQAWHIQPMLNKYLLIENLPISGKAV